MSTTSSRTSSGNNSPMLSARSTPRRTPKLGQMTRDDVINLKEDTKIVIEDLPVNSSPRRLGIERSSEAAGSSSREILDSTIIDGFGETDAHITDNSPENVSNTTVTGKNTGDNPLEVGTNNGDALSEISKEDKSPRTPKKPCSNTSYSDSSSPRNADRSSNSSRTIQNSPKSSSGSKANSTDSIKNRQNSPSIRSKSEGNGKEREFTCSPRKTASILQRPNSKNSSKESAGSTAKVVELNDIYPSNFTSLHRKVSSSSDYTDGSSMDQIEIEMTR